MAETHTQARVITTAAFATSAATLDLSFESVYKAREQLLVTREKIAARESELCRALVKELTTARGVTDAAKQLLAEVQAAQKLDAAIKTTTEELRTIDGSIAVLHACEEEFFRNPPDAMLLFLETRQRAILDERCDAVQIEHSREAKLTQITNDLQRVRTAIAARAAGADPCADVTGDHALATVQTGQDVGAYFEKQNVRIEARQTDSAGDDELKKKS